MLNQRRAVITGMGVVSALGSSLDSFWQGLTSAKSGIRKISSFDTSELPCKIAGEVLDFDPSQFMERKDVRRVPRSTHFAVAAATQAIADAGLSNPVADPERTGVLYASAIGGLDQMAIANQNFLGKGYRGLPPTQLPSGIANMPAFWIAHLFQILGPNNTVITACAASTQSVGEAAEWIKRGSADIVITGGTDAIVIPLVVGAFSAMRALPTNFNDRPEEASRPFDSLREGFVLSEGANALVVEEYEHAKARGAQIYAEVAGQASSSDGFDMIALQPEGHGPARAMLWALQNAGIRPDEVSYINAHGTSTPLNDKTETLAIKTVFGETAYEVPISSTKSMLGHAMGASGGFEAIVCAMAIKTGTIPPTINYENPDPECDLYYVPNQAIQKNVKYTLSNSFGLGGQNACLVLKQI